MLRALLLSSVLLSAMVPAASARLVYHRTGTNQIVAARDDGSRARVITHGQDVLVAPNGRHALVATYRRGGAGPDMRLVSTSGGRARLLLRDAGFVERSFGGPNWSPNSRYVVAPDASGFTHLFDVKARRHRKLNAALFGSGSFSPDSSRLALALGDLDEDHSHVFLYSLRRERFKKLRYQGDLLTWGRGGLAYYTGWGLEVRTRPRGRAHRLMAHPPGRSVRPWDWSAGGHVLLAETEKLYEPMRAVLIKPASGAVRTLPNSFSEVNDLSRNGKRVLGVIDGNVVSVAPNGSTRVLARGADSPSWNR
jgi:hypothetical protein